MVARQAFFDDFIEALESRRFLVVGDAILDRYIWGTADRLSREAPVPILNVTEETYSAGGAANVACNIANLGIQVEFIAKLGKDTNGERLKEILKEHSIKFNEDHLQVSAPTITKTRITTTQQQLCRFDKQGLHENYHLNNKTISQLLDGPIKQSDAILLSDYANGIITQDLADYLSQNSETLITVDPHPSNLVNWKNPTLISPNEAEAYMLAGYDISEFTLPPIPVVAQKLYEKYQARYTIITLGSKGIAVAEDGKFLGRVPTSASEVFDVSGAGDTVIALLTAALIVDIPILEAIHLSNLAAGTIVQKLTTIPIQVDELREAFRSKPNFEVFPE